MGEQVVGSDGRTWIVRRQWAPRPGSKTLFGRFRRFVVAPLRERHERLPETSYIIDTGGMFEELPWVAGAILLVGLLVLVVLIAFVVALELTAVDVVMALVIAGLVVMGRVVFRRPWTIEAAADGTVQTWQVIGWRASRERRDEIAEQLATGVTPPAT